MAIRRKPRSGHTKRLTGVRPHLHAPAQMQKLQQMQTMASNALKASVPQTARAEVRRPVGEVLPPQRGGNPQKDEQKEGREMRQEYAGIERAEQKIIQEVQREMTTLEKEQAAAMNKASAMAAQDQGLAMQAAQAAQHLAQATVAKVLQQEKSLMTRNMEAVQQKMARSAQGKLGARSGLAKAAR